MNKGKDKTIVKEMHAIALELKNLLLKNTNKSIIYSKTDTKTNMFQTSNVYCIIL